jgi:hypothetical protein
MSGEELTSSRSMEAQVENANINANSRSSSAAKLLI